MTATRWFGTVVLVAIGIGTVSPRPVAQGADWPTINSFEDIRPSTPEERQRAAQIHSEGTEDRLEAVWQMGGGGKRSGIYDYAASPFLPSKKQRLESHRQDICLRPAIFLGRATGAKVMSNLESTWLFTDYTVDVDRWLYSRADRPRTPSTTTNRLTVTWGGGEVRRSGRRFFVITEMKYPTLNQRYLVLTKPMPEGAGYFGEIQLIENGKVFHPVLQRWLAFDDYVMDLTRVAAKCKP